MRTWIFFEEGKQGQPQFVVEAPNSRGAYDKAYNKYGPQVDDLMYTEKPEKKFTCSICDVRFEISFRAWEGWDYMESDYGSTGSGEYFEICHNCHGPSVCIGMMTKKPKEAVALSTDPDLPF